MHMTVGSAASKNIVVIGENESLHRAEELMRHARVRRLPVVDAGGRIVGLISLSDLARCVPQFGERVAAHSGRRPRRGLSPARSGDDG